MNKYGLSLFWLMFIVAILVIFITYNSGTYDDLTIKENKDEIAKKYRRAVSFSKDKICSFCKDSNVSK